MGYDNAVNSIKSIIGDLLRSVEVWNDVLGRLEPITGEDSKFAERREGHIDLVAKATKKIEEVHAIYGEVTKRRTTPDQRVNSFVLHSEKI